MLPANTTTYRSKSLSIWGDRSRISNILSFGMLLVVAGILLVKKNLSNMLPFFPSGKKSVKLLLGNTPCDTNAITVIAPDAFNAFPHSYSVPPV